MNDSFLMCGFQRVGNLPRDDDGVVLKEATGACNQLRQRLTLDQFEDQEADAVGVLNPVDGANVRMIQRRQHPRLALEAREPIGIGRKCFWQHLDRDVTSEGRVVSPVDLAHAPGAEQRQQTIGAHRPACERLARGFGYPLRRRA